MTEHKSNRIKTWMRDCVRLVLPRVSLLVLDADPGPDGIEIIADGQSISGTKTLDFGVASPNYITLKNLPMAIECLNRAAWREAYVDVMHGWADAFADEYVLRSLRNRMEDDCTVRDTACIHVEPIAVGPSPTQPMADRHTLRYIVMPRLPKWELPA